jgi:hypothetical protein
VPDAPTAALAVAVATVLDGGEGSGGVRLQPSSRPTQTPNAQIDDTLIAADFRTVPRGLSPRPVTTGEKRGQKNGTASGLGGGRASTRCRSP